MGAGERVVYMPSYQFHLQCEPWLCFVLFFFLAFNGCSTLQAVWLKLANSSVCLVHSGTCRLQLTVGEQTSIYCKYNTEWNRKLSKLSKKSKSIERQKETGTRKQDDKIETYDVCNKCIKKSSLSSFEAALLLLLHSHSHHDTYL